MDPATATQIAGTALQIAQGAWSVGTALYNFAQDVKNLKATAEAFASEIEALGGACSLVSKRVKSIVQEQAAGQSFTGDVSDLMASLERQLSGCRKTTDQLQTAVQCVSVEGLKDAGVWKRMVKQIQLSMKTDTIELARNRVRSHTSGLQLTLQTIAM